MMSRIFHVGQAADVPWTQHMRAGRIALVTAFACFAACEGSVGGPSDDISQLAADASAGDPGAVDSGATGRMRITSQNADGGEDADDFVGGPLPVLPETNSDGGPKALPALFTVEKGCDMLALRRCSRLRECAPFLFQALYGKEDICKSRTRFACLTEAADDDTGWNPVAIVACAQGVADLSCADLLSRNGPAACQATGTRSDGTRCGSNGQCSSGYCALADGACGTCQPRGATAAACTYGYDDQCASKHVCSRAGRCVMPAMINAECDPVGAPCETHLACIEGSCAKPLAAETSCESSAWCNQAIGQTCMAASSASDQRVCAASPVAQPDEACGHGDEVTRMCTGGPANCRPDPKGGLHCVPPARDGEACGEQADGRTCIAPARCLASRCRLGAIDGC